MRLGIFGTSLGIVAVYMSWSMVSHFGVMLGAFATGLNAALLMTDIINYYIPSRHK